MKDRINELKERFAKELSQVSDQGSLEELRLAFLSKKGQVSQLMQELAKIPNEQKKEAGQLINSFKQEISARFDAKMEEIRKIEEECLINKTESYDESLPERRKRGSYHPITLVQRELEDIFESMGFDVIALRHSTFRLSILQGICRTHIICQHRISSLRATHRPHRILSCINTVNSLRRKDAR